MDFVRGLEHSSWAEHHRTSCVRPVDGQSQGGATGRQRVRSNNPDKEEEEFEAGRRPGCGERVVIGQFSINKLKIITKTHVSVCFFWDKTDGSD